jgi:uridine kinase
VGVAPIADALRELFRVKTPLLVAIDGFGGAGKSTLAQRLADELGAAHVIALDDFIVKEHTADDTWDLAWDRARLVQEVLEPVRRGERPSHRRLLWNSNTLSEPIEAPQADVVIVEGITTLLPELRGYWDYSVWVETPVEVARERGRLRDAGNENEAQWDRWSANDLRYLRAHDPRGLVNHVVRND